MSSTAELLALFLTVVIGLLLATVVIPRLLGDRLWDRLGKAR